ncbi:MAG: PIG-L family deacetylase [Anaerolineae bacterium]|nr:PIG-L family deacetylase [Anaerolineae bacterium]MDH7475565.1 PIG-L family deacetylase [Anaerolineae bacterium]
MTIHEAIRQSFRHVRRLFSPGRIITTAFLLLVVLGVLSFYLGYLSSLPAPFVGELEDVAAIQRLLVVAPHCDDEVISSGGLIREVLLRGGQVRVVIVTNGDGSFTGTMVEFRKLYPKPQDYLRSGVARQQESLKALESLGVPPENVLFLSYPDRGILPLWETFWDNDTPYRSPFTKLTQSPYDLTYNPQAVYSGHSLLSDLRSILEDFQPDAVVAPHPDDTHPDHWASGAFVALAVAMQKEQVRPRLLLYLVHRGDYPLPRGDLPFAPLLPPLRLVHSTFTWGKVTLTDEVRDEKGAAIELYKSQLHLLGEFLRSFVRQNEVFCEFTPHNTTRLVDNQDITPMPSQWQTVDGSEVTPVMEDSARDTVPQEFGAAADFVALYAARSKNELWISAEMRGKPSRLVAYSCLVRAANGREISEARVVYPFNIRSRPTAETRDRFVLVRFNLAELGHPHTVIASFEAHYPGGPTIDRIGWAILHLD